MMARFLVLALFAALFVFAAPGQASAGTAIPEPSDLALFLLGLIGVIVGRQGVLIRRRQERDEDGSE